jgi:hypothetical protein
MGGSSPCRRDRCCHAAPGPFTVSPPRGAVCSPLRYRRRRETFGMADVLVAAGIVAFVAAMLGLIWCLERI